MLPALLKGEAFKLSERSKLACIAHANESRQDPITCQLCDQGGAVPSVKADEALTCVLRTEKVEPPGVEPGSKQATPAAFSMLSPRLIFDQRLTVDGPSLT